jgi:hypothetical protein
MSNIRSYLYRFGCINNIVGHVVCVVDKELKAEEQVSVENDTTSLTRLITVLWQGECYLRAMKVTCRKRTLLRTSLSTVIQN